MKRLFIAISSLCLFAFGCSSPKPFEIKDVCSQAEGTGVILSGYLSLPKTIDTIQLTKGGAIKAVGYQIFLMSKADVSGDSVNVTIWTSDKGEPNKIKPLPANFAREDLTVYADDSKAISVGAVIKVTGEIVTDAKTGCAVNVTKIETQ